MRTLKIRPLRNRSHRRVLLTSSLAPCANDVQKHASSWRYAVGNRVYAVSCPSPRRLHSANNDRGHDLRPPRSVRVGVSGLGPPGGHRSLNGLDPFYNVSNNRGSRIPVRSSCAPKCARRPYRTPIRVEADPQCPRHVFTHRNLHWPNDAHALSESMAHVRCTSRRGTPILSPSPQCVDYVIRIRRLTLSVITRGGCPAPVSVTLKPAQDDNSVEQ